MKLIIVATLAALTLNGCAYMAGGEEWRKSHCQGLTEGQCSIMAQQAWQNLQQAGIQQQQIAAQQQAVQAAQMQDNDAQLNQFMQQHRTQNVYCVNCQ